MSKCFSQQLSCVRIETLSYFCSAVKQMEELPDGGQEVKEDPGTSSGRRWSFPSLALLSALTFHAKWITRIISSGSNIRPFHPQICQPQAWNWAISLPQSCSWKKSRNRGGAATESKHREWAEASAVERLQVEERGPWRLKSSLKLVVSTGENSGLYLQWRGLSTGGKEKSKLLKGKRIQISNGPDFNISPTLTVSLSVPHREGVHTLRIYLFGETTRNRESGSRPGFSPHSTWGPSSFLFCLKKKKKIWEEPSPLNTWKATGSLLWFTTWYPWKAERGRTWAVLEPVKAWIHLPKTNHSVCFSINTMKWEQAREVITLLADL